MAIALQSGTGEARELANLLGRPHLDPDGLVSAAALVESCGGRDGAEAQAAEQLGRALATLDAAPIDSGARADLAGIARFVAARQF